MDVSQANAMIRVLREIRDDLRAQHRWTRDSMVFVNNVSNQSEADAFAKHLESEPGRKAIARVLNQASDRSSRTVPTARALEMLNDLAEAKDNPVLWAARIREFRKELRS